jgi:hypothetical protein
VTSIIANVDAILIVYFAYTGVCIIMYHAHAITVAVFADRMLNITVMHVTSAASL